MHIALQIGTQSALLSEWQGHLQVNETSKAATNEREFCLIEHLLKLWLEILDYLNKVPKHVWKSNKFQTTSYQTGSYYIIDEKRS